MSMYTYVCECTHTHTKSCCFSFNYFGNHSILLYKEPALLFMVAHYSFEWAIHHLFIEQAPYLMIRAFMITSPLPWTQVSGSIPATAIWDCRSLSVSSSFFLLTVSATPFAGSNSSLRLCSQLGETQGPSASLEALFLLILTSFHTAELSLTSIPGA